MPLCAQQITMEGIEEEEKIESCSSVEMHLGRYQEPEKYPESVRIHHFSQYFFTLKKQQEGNVSSNTSVA